jgi:hypothetical protein
LIAASAVAPLLQITKLVIPQLCTRFLIIRVISRSSIPVNFGLTFIEKLLSNVKFLRHANLKSLIASLVGGFLSTFPSHSEDRFETLAQSDDTFVAIALRITSHRLRNPC